MSSYKSDFLNILEQRGFIHQCSDFEALDAKLSSGDVQSAYIGFDPTGPSLHVGHLYTIMILHWFQQSGHKPISLMGGGTALIPDPTLKDKTRPLLGPEDINKNIKSIKTVFSNFVDYNDSKTGAIMVNNYDWLAKLDYIEFLRDVGMHFTVNRMLTFDSVKTRLERELPMTFIEFNYMILQAYDFVELHKRYGTILQMGGSDQWGNIINGVELGRKMEQAQLFGLTAPLLTSASGSKMGKTEGGAVWLNADMTSPYDYYQYWRNVEDADTIKLLKVFTLLPIDEIAKLETLEGADLNEAKKILAFETTKMIHGEQAAREAQETAAKVFEQGAVGDDLPSIEIDASRLSGGVNIMDLFVETGLAASKGEVKRLIKGGGARLNDNKIEDQELKAFDSDLTSEGYMKLSAGKKKHAIVRVIT